MSSEKESLSEVRELVNAASAILKKLGPDKARVGWLLEEALVFLDDSEEANSSFSSESVINYLDEIDDKAVNS